MGVETADGVELLLDAGLERRVVGPAEVEISTGDGRWSRRQVLLLRHSPSPTEIARALSAAKTGLDGVYFVVGRAGAALTKASADDRRVAYAAVDDGVVVFQTKRYATDAAPDAARPGPARVSWVRLAILRLLALSPETPTTQVAIARQLGVSHVAVGKQLAELAPLLDKLHHPVTRQDRNECWDRFLAEYPGPRGLATYWAASDDLRSQFERIEAARATQPTAGPLVVSGDLAADHYAPWRRPTRAVIYVGEQLPLDAHGFAIVRTGDATVELRVPKDPTIVAMSRRWDEDNESVTRRYADPLVTAWDLHRTRGGDVPEALHRLRDRALGALP